MYIKKIDSLLKRSSILSTFEENELTAVKLHFGERGSFFIKPVYIQRIVKILQRKGVIPFLTDTNTLYVGERNKAPSHNTPNRLKTLLNVGVRC
jgi:hypothetical protein